MRVLRARSHARVAVEAGTTGRARAAAGCVGSPHEAGAARRGAEAQPALCSPSRFLARGSGDPNDAV